MGRRRGAPCDKCGGTMKRHAGGCALGGRKAPRRRYGSQKLVCGKTTRKAGKMTTHIDHACTIELVGKSPHPGLHVCSVPQCEVTWS